MNLDLAEFLADALGTGLPSRRSWAMRSKRRRTPREFGVVRNSIDSTWPTGFYPGGSRTSTRLGSHALSSPVGSASAARRSMSVCRNQEGATPRYCDCGCGGELPRTSTRRRQYLTHHGGYAHVRRQRIEKAESRPTAKSVARQFSECEHRLANLGSRVCSSERDHRGDGEVDLASSGGPPCRSSRPPNLGVAYLRIEERELEVGLEFPRCSSPRCVLESRSAADGSSSWSGSCHVEQQSSFSLWSSQGAGRRLTRPRRPRFPLGRAAPRVGHSTK